MYAVIFMRVKMLLRSAHCVWSDRKTLRNLPRTEGELSWADEYKLGSAKNVDPEIAEAFKRYFK